MVVHLHVAIIGAILSIAIGYLIGYFVGSDTGFHKAFDDIKKSNDRFWEVKYNDKCFELSTIRSTNAGLNAEITNAKERLAKALNESAAIAERYSKLEAEYNAYKASQNEKIDELYINVKNLVEKKDSDHELDIQCNTCYWREQMTRDRDDFMNTIAAKEAIIQNLQKALGETKAKNKPVISGFTATDIHTNNL